MVVPLKREPITKKREVLQPTQNKEHRSIYNSIWREPQIYMHTKYQLDAYKI